MLPLGPGSLRPRSCQGDDVAPHGLHGPRVSATRAVLQQGRPLRLSRPAASVNAPNTISSFRHEVANVRVQPRVLGSAALVVALTGASRGARHETTAPGACSLITQQEAAKALGKAVPVGTERVMTFPLQGRSVKAEMCFYGSEVSVVRYALGSAAQSYFTQYRQSLAGKSGYQDVKGLGDEAFAAKGQLTVRKGETQLIVDVGQARGGGAKELEAEKSLAVLALGRL
jgi:hypothetical protein